MPVILDTTVGGTAANAYCDVAGAIAYLNNRLNSSAYALASADDQARALIEASLEMDMLEGYWEGQRADSLQLMSWPRQFAIDPDKPQIIGVKDISQLYFPTTVVPTRIVKATCELALEFLRAGTTDVAGLDKTLAIQSKDVDVLRTNYVTPSQRAQGLRRFPRVVKLIAPLLDPSRSGGMQLVRV